MATYYWVGGSGTWDNATKTNWSLSSGGAGGAGFPTAADAVIINASSGSGTITLGANVNGLTLNMTGYTGTLDFGSYKISLAGNTATVFTGATTYTLAGTPVIDFTYSGSTGTRNISTANPAEANTITFNITGGSDTISSMTAVNGLNFSGFSGTYNLTTATMLVYGDLTLSSGMTLNAGTGPIYFYSASKTQRVTTNGKTIDHPIFVGNGTASANSVVLQDALTIGSTRLTTLSSGTLNGNGQNVSLGTFALGTGTKTLTLGSGIWTVAGSGTAWNANTNVSGLTVSASTGTISMTSGSAKTFAGGGKTWPTLNQGGAGALTIQQSNTFADITATAGGRPSTVTLTASTTQTLTQFTLSGTAGNLITLNTTVAGTQATLSDASGTNSISYVSLKDINATGGALWQAYTTNGNVNAGNNTGWDFDPTAFHYIYSRRKNKVILPF